jgi:hypothetical protein
VLKNKNVSVNNGFSQAVVPEKDKPKTKAKTNTNQAPANQPGLKFL